MSSRPSELRQVSILTRHFFERLFRNDMIDFADQMKEKLIVTLTLLAVFFTWAAWLMLFKYHFVPDLNRSWQDKTYLLTLMMLAFAIVTLLEWDVLFPDRRDFVNLLALPVRLRTLLAAKLASFGVFIGFFSLAMMTLPSILFAFYLAEWRTRQVAFAARYVFAHLVSGVAAGTAVFFGIIFLQFLLMAALPGPLFRRAATLVRFAMAVGLVFVLLSFIAAPSILGQWFREFETLKARGDPTLSAFPPVWFAGLYETLLGTTDPFFEAGARKAAATLILALAAFTGAAAVSYARHVGRTLEARRSARPLAALGRAWRGLLGRSILRSPEERAVHGFFVGTLRSSLSHKMTLAYYLAAGSAILLTLVVSHRRDLQVLTPQNGLFLILPLLPAFTVVAALRAVVDRPASLESNWIFRLTETTRTGLYASGLKKAVALRFLLPLFAAVAVLHAALWDVRTAAAHAAFGLIVSLLALEAVFFRYRKIPFACSWVPGKLRLQFTVIPCSIGLLLLLMLLAAIERAVLADPVRGLVFLGVAAAAGLALRAGNRRFYRTAALSFDEEPPDVLIQLPSGD